MEGVKTIEAARIRAQGIKLQPTAALPAADANRCADLLYALADELEAARKEIKVTEEIAVSYKRVLDACPPCEVHGPGCVPHAVDWIAGLVKERDAERARAEKAEREREEFRMRLELSQESLTRVVHERNDLRARLADLERWREQAGPVVEAARQDRESENDSPEEDEALGELLHMPLPQAPKVTP